MQFVFFEAVHQKANVAQLHAVNRQISRQEPVQGTQHESIPAQCHDDSSIFQITLPVALLQRAHRCVSLINLAGYKVNFSIRVHGVVSTTRRSRARTATATVG